MCLGLNLRRFTVAEFQRMRELRIVPESEHLELLDGIVITMAAIGLRHWHRHSAIVAHLVEALGGRAAILPQTALPLGDYDAPWPDVVVAAAHDAPWSSPPEPQAVLALIELTGNPQAAEAVVRRQLYARHGIADYLLVDLEQNVVLHHSGGDPAGYSEPARLSYGDRVQLRELPGTALSIDPFLAPLA